MAESGQGLVPYMDWSNPDHGGMVAMFKQGCNLCFSIKNIAENKQVDHILLFAGEQGLRIYDSCDMDDQVSQDPQDCMGEIRGPSGAQVKLQTEPILPAKIQADRVRIN